MLTKYILTILGLLCILPSTCTSATVNYNSNVQLDSFSQNGLSYTPYKTYRYGREVSLTSSAPVFPGEGHILGTGDIITPVVRGISNSLVQSPTVYKMGLETLSTDAFSGGIPMSGPINQAIISNGKELVSQTISNQMTTALSYVGPVIAVGTTSYEVYNDLSDGDYSGAVLHTGKGVVSWYAAGAASLKCGALATAATSFLGPFAVVPGFIGGLSCAMTTNYAISYTTEKANQAWKEQLITSCSDGKGTCSSSSSGKGSSSSSSGKGSSSSSSSGKGSSSGSSSGSGSGGRDDDGKEPPIFRLPSGHDSKVLFENHWTQIATEIYDELRRRFPSEVFSVVINNGYSVRMGTGDNYINVYHHPNSHDINEIIHFTSHRSSATSIGLRTSSLHLRIPGFSAIELDIIGNPIIRSEWILPREISRFRTFESVVANTVKTYIENMILRGLNITDLH